MKKTDLQTETKNTRTIRIARLFLAVFSTALLTIMISQDNLADENNENDGRVTVSAFKPASIRKQIELHPLIPFFAINEY